MDWIPDAVQVVGTILGAGAVTAAVQGWNKRREAQEERKTKAQAAHQEDRKDAVSILREALSEERKDHASCQERVTVVEAAMFREREERERERRECREEVARARQEGREEADQLRELLLEAYVKSTPVAERDTGLLAKLGRKAPPNRLDVVELDPARRKG